MDKWLVTYCIMDGIIKVHNTSILSDKNYKNQRYLDCLVQSWDDWLTAVDKYRVKPKDALNVILYSDEKAICLVEANGVSEAVNKFFENQLKMQKFI